MRNTNNLVIASFDVDCQNGFTPLCPDELPIEDGHTIVDALNEQAKFADYRVGSVDWHLADAYWVATEERPQLTPIKNAKNMDVRWKRHCVAGTYGAQLLKGLPLPIDYDFMVYKGLERDTHPYGACYHDLEEKQSTGVIEFLKSKNVNVVILGGLAENYCVNTTARQLISAGFKVFLNLSATKAFGLADFSRKELENRGVVLLKDMSEFDVKKIPQDIKFKHLNKLPTKEEANKTIREECYLFILRRITKAIGDLEKYTSFDTDGLLSVLSEREIHEIVEYINSKGLDAKLVEYGINSKGKISWKIVVSWK